jgi:lipoprotein-anchoring transpeptidase ErfK/SrfK
VRRFVERVAAGVDRPARNASLRITLRRMVVLRSFSGRALERGRAGRLIDRALGDDSAPRRLRVRLRKLRPSVKVRQLRRIYASVITIDRARFRLRLFERLRLSRSYLVAVGQPAYPTPSGLFHITSKQVNPVWTAPHSPWAGELAGTSLPGGSTGNPLRARWMGITDGVGIHGTGEDWSIGHAASHGCIRMHVWDVIELFRLVPLGSPVLIG